MPVFIFLLLVLIPSSLVAQAPDPQFQSNWSPNSYKIVCDPPFYCNLNEETRESVEGLVAVAVEDLKKTSFKAPRWWAPRKVSDTGEEFIELPESGLNNVAYVSCRVNPDTGHIVGANMNIGNRFSYFRDNDAEYWNYNFVSHELFHLIQYEYPFWDPGKCGKNVPGWVMESTATAYATHMMRKRFTKVWPSRRNQEEARDFAGLRRYDTTMPVRVFNGGGEVTSGLPIYQRISSFWRHVAHVHYGGKYDFLAKYMTHEAPAGDWVAWLRDNIQRYTGAHLGLVFGGFLADFAGWSDGRLPGEIFNREDWLKEAFDGCESVHLNKSKAFEYVELEIEPLAGDCIEVNVAATGPIGLAEGESAAVQIAAVIMTGAPSSRGGVHLGLAYSNDKKKFHCAREVKRDRKTGVGKCLFIPDDGKIRLNGYQHDARVWNVIAQEKGDPEEMRQEATTGSEGPELKNLYTVSYTPTRISMRDTSHSSKAPITVGLYFVLDVTSLEMEGNKKGAVGTFNEGGSDPQTTLPKQDASGKRVNSYSKPDQFQMPVPVPAALPQQVQGKLGTIVVGAFAENADTSDGVVLLPGKENSEGKVVPYALSVGETGSFPILVNASRNGEHVIGIDGTALNVEEFSDLVFRARYSGTLCRIKDLIVEQQSSEEICRNPFPMSGEIVKAFAGTRLAGQYMVTERTEGTEMYRKVNEQGMAEWSSTATDSEGSGEPGSTSPGSGSSSGGELPDCACTCEERAETLSRGEAIKAQQDAGEEVAAGAVMDLMRCTEQCRSEYMMCVMAEDKQKKAEEEAEKAARELEQAKECDCSCAAMNRLQGRTEELLKAMQAGSPTAMDEMQRLGSCMSVCQSAMMTCAQSR